MLKYRYLKIYFKSGCGREIGIRTPGGFHTSTVFKTAAFDRSAISRIKICDYNQLCLKFTIISKIYSVFSLIYVAPSFIFSLVHSLALWVSSFTPCQVFEQPAIKNAINTAKSKFLTVIPSSSYFWSLEATPGFEPGIKALQAHALPLGHVAILVVPETGLEPVR